jgi:hypothetical protein
MSTYKREKLLFYPAKFSLYESIFEHLDLSILKEQLPKNRQKTLLSPGYMQGFSL